MSAATAELVRTEAAPGTYRNCVSCDRRTHRDEMLDEWECRACHQAHLDKQQRRKLNQQLAEQKKAVGQAFNSMATAIANGQFLVDKPHDIFRGLMKSFGGVDGFCQLYRERFDVACDPEQGSQKVAADILKSIVVMSVEAAKTAPPPPNFNSMSDEEMADEFARLVQQKMYELEEVKRIAELPAVADPLPEDRPDLVGLLMAAQTGGSRTRQSTGEAPHVLANVATANLATAEVA